MNNQTAATGVFVIDDQGRILCLHRKIGFREGGKYGIPGGMVRKSKGILGTAIYKLNNEAGIKCQPEDLKSLGEFKYKVDGVNIVFNLFIFNTKKNQKKIDVNLNLEGHDKLIWEYPTKLLGRKDLMVGMYTLLPAYISYIDQH
jgi:8-oxo-dGTP pyrophosphatase MutT (NUDIX family)